MNTPFIRRDAAAKIRDLSTQFPCVLVTGARQVGKSTLLKAMMPEGMRYITLDDYRLADQARHDPIGLLEAYGTPLCIDEIQYAPQLLRAIKLKVDAEKRPGMYWLTGSQRFHMMKGVSESLVGRIGIIELQSLSQREITGQGGAAVPFGEGAESTAAFTPAPAVCNVEELYRRIWLGGYPALHENPERSLHDYFTAYLQTYIQRDVQDLLHIADHNAFHRFIQSAAARSGQQLVYADLARDADVAPNTVKCWVSVLEASGIISLLPPYYINTSKRLTKSPKLYFCDTGLCAWLCRWTSPETLQHGAFAGAILETWVYNQLSRSYTNAGLQPPLTYYRDSNGNEVDFLIRRDGALLPVEVKKSDSPTASALSAVRTIPLAPADILLPGIVLCTAQQTFPLSASARAYPISAL